MAEAYDFEDHATVNKMLGEAQKADRDQREHARECRLFVHQRQGQWEQEWWEAADNKPRYTFDMTTPLVDQVDGELKKAEFNVKVRPAGGDATEDQAELLDGIIRNIENQSRADRMVYGPAGRGMLISGQDGWRVVQKYVDGNSFDQDLCIERLQNFDDRVWFDPMSELPDRSDARFCWVMSSMSPEEYEAQFPEGSAQSIKTDRWTQAFYYKADDIIVGEFYYIKKVKKTLVLMSNGAVYEDNDEFKSVKDDLELQGVTEAQRRERKVPQVYIRKMDANGWLGEAEETVFSKLPVVPVYGNFEVIESKVLYSGLVERLLDPQRVMNYSMSREVEEGALAPRAKYWMTMKQASGHERTLRTLNTNADPVQFFNHDEDYPGAPQQNGGAQINPGLRVISESMRQIMGQAAGLFAASMGDNPGLQSGVAIEKLQDRGETGTVRWFQAMEIAIARTGEILVDAIPKVYDTRRTLRILKEDGKVEMVVVNDLIMDAQTGKVVKLNDLSVGQYDVVCDAGPAFKNRQQETVSGLLEAAQVDPSLIAVGADVLLGNMTAPGMGIIADRKRMELIRAGVIPPDQLTDEEKAQIQQAQMQAAQNQQPDAAMVLAQAELQKAQADMANAQIKEAQVIGEQQLKARQQQIDMMKIRLEAMKSQDKSALEAEKLQLEVEKLEQDISLSMQEQERKNADTISQIESREVANQAKVAETFQKQQEIVSGPVSGASSGDYFSR